MAEKGEEMSTETKYASCDSMTAKSIVEDYMGTVAVCTDIFRVPPCEEEAMQHIRILGVQPLEELLKMITATIKDYRKKEKEQEGKGLPF